MFALRRSTPFPPRSSVTRPRPCPAGLGKVHEHRAFKQLLTKANNMEDEGFRQMREAPQGPAVEVGPTADPEGDGSAGAARRLLKDSKPLDLSSLVGSAAETSDREKVLLAFLASTGFYVTRPARLDHDTFKVGVVMDYEALEKMDRGLASLYFQFIQGRNEETGFTIGRADKFTVFSILKRQRLIALGQAQGELVLRQSSSSDKFSRLVLKYKEGINHFEGALRRRGGVVLAALLACAGLLAWTSFLAWTTAMFLWSQIHTMVIGSA